MGLPNLKLRGGSYHWRRKIMAGDQRLPLSISLRTGNFYRARLISSRLSVAVEGCRRDHQPAAPAHITAPAETVRSLNGVIVHRHRPIEFVEEADAVLIGSGVRMREIAADPAMLTR